MNGSICGSRSEVTRNNIGRRSSDFSLDVSNKATTMAKILEKSRWKVTRQLSEVTRPSADCQTTFFGRFKPFGNFFEKSRWTVTRQWSEVTRPSADCQTTFFGRFKQLGKILKKVAERSRDSGRRSRDRRPTVKQRFWTFQAIRKFFEKSRWTVTRQWSEVTRPSADCQTTFFGRFKQLENFLKKVAERSRDSGRRSRDRRPTVKQRFWTFQAIGKILKKVAERSRDSGRRSRDRRLTVKQRFWTFQAIRKLFVKTHRRVTRQWSVVTRLSADCQAHTCVCIKLLKESLSHARESREREREKQRFLEFRERLGKIFEKRAETESRESERGRERPNTKIRQKKLPRKFSRLLTPVPSLSVFHGTSPARDMWCFVAYVYNGRERWSHATVK